MRAKKMETFIVARFQNGIRSSCHKPRCQPSLTREPRRCNDSQKSPWRYFMSPSLRLSVVLLTFLMITSAAFAQPTIVNFDFGAVRIACGSGYTYEGPVGSCPYNAAPTQNFNGTPDFGWMLGW